MPRKKKTTGAAFDVRGLRKKLDLSQAALGKMLGASPNSVYNWERGSAPNTKYLDKLKALAGGKVKVASPTVGNGRPSPKKAHAPAPSAGAKRVGRPPSIRGDVPVLYANRATVQVSNGEARVRFGWALPGDPGVRAVADIVVPGDVLDRLRG